MEKFPLKIFNASAGSGKTYTLVQEYLRIIVHDKNPLKFRSILAMTFTNKAATEMKTRILEALIRLARPEHEKSAEDLEFLASSSSNLAIAPRLLEERSAKIVNAILHNYGSFSIMTIDKFTHRVIRSFARDLKLSVDFDVELDIAGMRKNVTDLLFDQIGRDDELTTLMMNYAQSNLDQDKSWNFSSHVFNFSAELFKEDAIKSIELLKKLSGADFLAIRENLTAENAKTEAALKRNATEALDLIASRHLTAEDFQGLSKGIVSFFRKIKSGEFKPASDTIKGFVAEDRWGHAKSPNKASADEIGGMLGQYFRQVSELLDGPYRQCLVNYEILKNLNNLSLMNHLLRLVEGIKEEENILLISDFYKKISDIITKEPVPFIYEKMGVRFEHFLLDEFQDTSNLQWINMVPLVHNSLASGNANLVVGDGKQAIYRWRGGEVEQFTSLPGTIYNPQKIASLTEAEKLFREMGKRYPLTENFRSAPEIVKFNNHLFEHLAATLPPGIAPIYEGVAQHPVKNFKGYIEVRFEDNMKEEEQFGFISDTIAASLQRGFELKDICVLTRRNITGAKIADYLSQKGIRVISPDSLFIGKDLAVKFIFNVISAAAIPADRNYKIKALGHFSSLVLKEQPGILFEKWKDKLGYSSIETIFAELGYSLQRPVRFHNLYEYVESVIEAFGLDLTNNAYLQFFLEEAHVFEKKNNSSLRDFIEAFKEKGAMHSIVSPEGSNAVQVMTIFKAKGLQFPVVICPFFDWRMDLNRQVSWVENESGKLPAYFVNMTQSLEKTELKGVFDEENAKFLLDNLNLLYVAFTRPEVALFISGNASAVQSPGSFWLKNYFKSCPLLEQKNGAYTCGEFINPGLKKKQALPAYPVTFLRQVMNKPALSLKSAERWSVDDLDGRRMFGTKVHLLLSRMEKQAGLETCLRECRVKGLVDPQDVDALREAIKGLFTDPNFARYFEGSKCLNEKEIIAANGLKLIPDKLVFENEKVLVVDFKTGQKSNAHVDQVMAYIVALRDMGYTNVSGEIYYTSTQEMLKVKGDF